MGASPRLAAAADLDVRPVCLRSAAAARHDDASHFLPPNFRLTTLAGQEQAQDADGERDAGREADEQQQHADGAIGGAPGHGLGERWCGRR